MSSINLARYYQFSADLTKNIAESCSWREASPEMQDNLQEEAMYVEYIYHRISVEEVPRWPR